MPRAVKVLAALVFMGAAAVLPGHPSPAEVRQAYAQASIQACRTQVCTRPREGCMEDMDRTAMRAVCFPGGVR